MFQHSVSGEAACRNSVFANSSRDHSQKVIGGRIAVTFALKTIFPSGLFLGQMGVWGIQGLQIPKGNKQFMTLSPFPLFDNMSPAVQEEMDEKEVSFLHIWNIKLWDESQITSEGDLSSEVVGRLNFGEQNGEI